MSIIKLINRNFILPLIKVSHLSELIARYSSHNNLILNYHGVVKNYDSTLTKNHLPIDQFAFQMQYFKKQCHILNLEEIFNNKFDQKVNSKYKQNEIFYTGEHHCDVVSFPNIRPEQCGINRSWHL